MPEAMLPYGDPGWNIDASVTVIEKMAGITAQQTIERLENSAERKEGEDDDWW